MEVLSSISPVIPPNSRKNKIAQNLSARTNAKTNAKTNSKTNAKTNTRNVRPFSSNEITLIKDPSALKNNNFPTFLYEGGDGFKGVKFYLKNGESINANGGAMNYMSGDMKIRTTMGGGFLSTLVKGISRAVSGSSVFYNNFYNNSDIPQYIAFAGINPGNIGCFYIPPRKKFILVSHSYICSTPNLTISGKLQLGGFILGYGLFYVTVQADDNAGLIWGASFGDVLQIELQIGESIKVDNGVLLGFDYDINFNTTTVGGLTSTFLSGEALVTLITNDKDRPINIFLKGRSDSAYIEYISNIVNKR